MIKTTFLIAIFLLHGLIYQTNTHEKQITFRIIPKTLPDTSTIFITGNHIKLGNWTPDAVILDQQADGSWSKTLSFKSETHLEYKFTRGSWQTEAVNAEGIVPSNLILNVSHDTTITIEIENWKDVVHRIEGQIVGMVKYHHLNGEDIKPRDLIVWLPPGYETSPKKRYPVLYMHDGQNIIDPKTSFIGIDWQIDETVDNLIRRGKLQEIIVVGIYNTDDREKEYSCGVKGQAYMKFLVSVVKPFIDKTYRTLPEAKHTSTMGSSMGGLISFLLTWNYPDVFSQAGCLSPAFGYNNEQAIKLVEAYQGNLKPIRIYMDNGSIGLEQVLQPGCDNMLQVLRKKGFKLGENLQWFYDKGAEHNERAWSKRAWRPLLFMYTL